jgi:hypothetical protein
MEYSSMPSLVVVATAAIVGAATAETAGSLHAWSRMRSSLLRPTAKALVAATVLVPNMLAICIVLRCWMNDVPSPCWDGEPCAAEVLAGLSPCDHWQGSSRGVLRTSRPWPVAGADSVGSESAGQCSSAGYHDALSQLLAWYLPYLASVLGSRVQRRWYTAAMGVRARLLNPGDPQAFKKGPNCGGIESADTAHPTTRGCLALCCTRGSIPCSRCVGAPQLCAGAIALIAGSAYLAWRPADQVAHVQQRMYFASAAAMVLALLQLAAEAAAAGGWLRWPHFDTAQALGVKASPAHDGGLHFDLTRLLHATAVCLYCAWLLRAISGDDVGE